MRSTKVLWIALAGTVACTSENALVPEPAKDPRVEVHPAYTDFFSIQPDEWEAQMPGLQKTYAPFFESLSPSQFVKLVNDPELRGLHEDALLAFPDTAVLSTSLREGFARYRSLFPGGNSTHKTRVYPFISYLDPAFYPPLVVDSSYVFLALDQYLGADHPAYAQDPAYLAYQREPRFAVPALFQQLAASKTTFSDGSFTLLDQMVYWGKLACFAEACLGEEQAPNLFPYTPDQWKFCMENEANLWKFFIQNRLLYATDIDLERRFIQPAPFSKMQTAQDQEIPGMVGRWLGYRLVRSYLENHPETHWSAFLKDTDSRTLLSQSQYRP
jgi:hypothetical protein